MKYHKRFNADDTLQSIGAQAGYDATVQNAREFSALRRSTPQIITVDETGKEPKVSGYMTYDDKAYERDPWRMYQYKPAAGEVRSDDTKKAAGRAVYIKEILPGGETRVTAKENFKKADGSILDESKTKNGKSYFDRLYRLTREGAQSAEEYDSGLYRTQTAANRFTNNQYVIEQKAALAQVPASMLGAAMFHYYSDFTDGSAGVALSDAEINELFLGSNLSRSGMNTEAVREYSKTEEGAAEIAAYILQSEAKKRGYDLSNLKGTQEQEILAAFNRKMKGSDSKGAVTKQMADVFEDVFASLPGRERAVTWREDSDLYYDFEDMFPG